MTRDSDSQFVFFNKVDCSNESDGSEGLEWLELVVEVVVVLHLNVEAADLDPVAHSDLVAAFLGDNVHGLGQTTPHTTDVHLAVVDNLVHCNK